jgi:hypothetical protein
MIGTSKSLEATQQTYMQGEHAPTIDSQLENNDDKGAPSSDLGGGGCRIRTLHIQKTHTPVAVACVRVKPWCVGLAEGVYSKNNASICLRPAPCTRGTSRTRGLSRQRRQVVILRSLLCRVATLQQASTQRVMLGAVVIFFGFTSGYYLGSFATQAAPVRDTECWYLCAEGGRPLAPFAKRHALASPSPLISCCFVEFIALAHGCWC